MSEGAFVAGLILGVLVAGGAAVMSVGFGASPVDEFDKICYEHDPNWTYQGGSALYWNDSLNITCEESVQVSPQPFPESEWKNRAELQLQEVEQ